LKFDYPAQNMLNQWFWEEKGVLFGIRKDRAQTIYILLKGETEDE